MGAMEDARSEADSRGVCNACGAPTVLLTHVLAGEASAEHDVAVLETKISKAQTSKLAQEAEGLRASVTQLQVCPCLECPG